MVFDQRQATRIRVRWMSRRDMPEVLKIERSSFEFPWLEHDFIRCTQQRNCVGIVAELDGEVVGFMVYELLKSRIQILNFAVSPRYRRHGVGSQLVEKLLGKLTPNRRNRIILEVRETNLPAQLFFRDNGFRAVALLRGYYDDTPEDAYRMQYRYKSQQQQPAPINRIAEYTEEARKRA